jgi:CRP-like cAMP-binding protein
MGDLLQELRLIPIFANINQETLGSLSKLLKEERFGQGEYVVREGDHAEAMYIIRSGEVEVRKAIRREAEKYKTLAILEKGDIFGEMAVFGEEFRSADVMARKDALLWKMDYSELFNILESDPAAGVKILQVIITILVARIKSLNRELTTLYELGQRLQQLNDIEDLTKVVFELVMSNVEPAEVGLLAILNIFNEEFDIHQSSEAIQERHIDYKDPVAVWMFENKTPLIVKDKASDPRFKDTFYSGLSFIASPFLHEERLLGFILLSNLSYQNAFSYTHMILLSTVCAQVGARLNELERKKEEILKQRLSQGRLTVKI